jgi:hypothetical protein
MKIVIMKRLALATLFSFFLFHQAVAADSRTAAAIMAAEDFLLLLDTGQYAQSWDAAASFFQSQIPKERWVQQISALRPPFGKVTNRLILDARHMTQLPGAPDGEYVVIQYESSFENKRQATETITPMLDNDGKWRVSGYYIQ